MSTQLHRFLSFAFVAALLISNPLPSFSQTDDAHSSIIDELNKAEAEVEHRLAGKEDDFNIGEMIMHHISDSHEWEFAHGIVLPLPVILYSPDRGMEAFMSSKFHNNNHEYQGYQLTHGDSEKIVPADASRTVYDLSITKNVASMLLSAILLLVIFGSVASAYTRRKGKAPSGFQSAMEVVILFIRDEVVKPNIGPNYQKYLPYMLTLFFFILINNLLGLLPGGANVTGNIAVTLTLAVITFIIVHINSNKHYWMHLVKPTGVPLALLPVMVPVEIVGVFMKPFSLMIRLFANMTAGHIILLSLFGLIFIFKSIFVAPVVSVFALFMNFIEIMVAFIQAFIFTLLSAMYIGSSIEEHHEADHGM